MRYTRPVLRLVLIAAVAFALPLMYYSDVISRWYGDLTADDGPPDKYFYDTEEFPPILSPAGNPAVRAHFYSCGGCSEEERFLGYYEKYALEAKKTMYDALRQEGPEGEPHLVYAWAFKGRLRSTDGVSWLKAESPEGRELAESLSGRCDETGKLRYCSP